MITGCGSFSQKLSQLNSLSYFTMLCGINCELAGCVHWLSWPNQILVSYTLARSVKLSRLSYKTLELPPRVTEETEDCRTFFH